MTLSLREDLEECAAAAGWNLSGAVDAERFDAGQPQETRCRHALRGCGTALVFAVGGDPERREGGPARDGARAEGVLAAMRRRVAAAGLRGRVLAAARSRRLNFARLAEAAGIGVVSPVIGALLHPRYGPWVALRAAVLLPGRPFGAIPDESLAEVFQPCAKCPRPCLEACPVGVHDGRGRSDLHRCVDHWRQGGCRGGCDVLRACPVGAGERWAGAVELHVHGETMAGLHARWGRRPWRSLRRLFGR